MSQMTSQIYCPVCAAVIAPGATYCGSCGSRLSPEMPAPPEVAQEAPPPPLGVFGIDYAGFWMRLLAWLVDLIPLTIVSLLVQLVTEDIATGLVLRILLGATYSIGFWVAADGVTPGKFAMGIKIVRSNGEPIGVGASILRYLGYVVSLIPLGLGFFMIGFSPQKRGLHDYIAQTVVVRVR
jgi:uncharacterized RDD family membrane protein YckC